MKAYAATIFMFFGVLLMRQTADRQAFADSVTPPAQPVRLIFIHHSTGENWLADGNGGLGVALRDNNYFVSDTNYGWGPDSIGDATDIGNWYSVRRRNRPRAPEGGRNRQALSAQLDDVGAAGRAHPHRDDLLSVRLSLGNSADSIGTVPDR